MANKSPRKLSPNWDAVIVGTGPAGTATAITLAREGCKVLLLEKHSSSGFKLGESLPPVSIGIVEHFLGSISALGVAQDDISETGIASTGVLDASAKRAGAIKISGNVSCWESNIPQVSDFFFTPNGYGLCIDRPRFDKALRTAAVNAGACLLEGAQLVHCHRAEGLASDWQVDVVNDTGKQSHNAKFLIDSSGRRAVVAKALGVPRHYTGKLFAYAQRFVCRKKSDNDRFTRIEAGPQGWWYSNRLPGAPQNNNGNISERLVVFHTDKDLAAAKLAANSAGFSNLLEESRHIRAYLDEYGYAPAGKIRGAAAGSERLSFFAGERWLAVGDAAQAYDPLSSQGIYKALSSGSTAGQMLHHALSESATASKGQLQSTYLKRYKQEQEQLWSAYLKQHDFYYQSQWRWSDQPFWSRRRQTENADSETKPVREAS